jgi:hypothetical protein
VGEQARYPRRRQQVCECIFREIEQAMYNTLDAVIGPLKWPPNTRTHRAGSIPAPNHEKLHGDFNESRKLNLY